MKDCTKVAALLEELKAQCTTEIERHRVEILARDFFDPPKAEQIDANHQKFDGMIYRRTKTGHYAKVTSIHQAVWNYFVGELVTGNEIHHKNSNPEDNDLSNLQSLTKAEHRRIHNLNAPTRLSKCKMCGKEFATRSAGKTLAKFCSDKCRDAYKFLSKESAVFEERICVICGKKYKTEKRSTSKTCSRKCTGRIRWSRPRVKIMVTCEICGKPFETNKTRPARFCSKRCKGKHDVQTHQVKRVCVVCGKEFTCYDRHKTKTCSAKCAAAMRFKNHISTPQTQERTCVICGAKFTCRKSKPTSTCSKSCSLRLRYQRERNHENKDEK